MYAYEQVRQIHFEELEERRGRLNRAGQHRASILHAAAIQSLSQRGPKWLSRKHMKRQVYRDVKRECCRRFGFFEQLIIQVLAGLIVQIIMAWIEREFFEADTFRGENHLDETLQQWASDSRKYSQP